MKTNGNSRHALLIFHPRITIRAESVAEKLHISLEQADQLLSRPGTYPLLQQALGTAFQDTIFKTLLEMIRVPHETVPVRVDCTVELPELPVARIFNET